MKNLMLKLCVLVTFFTCCKQVTASVPALQCIWFGKPRKVGETWSRGCKDFTCQENGSVTISTNPGCETKDQKCIKVNDAIEMKRGCKFLTCNIDGGKPIKTKGCKIGDKCYPSGHIERPNNCTELLCKSGGKLKAKSLGCETNDGLCKGNGEIWGDSGANSCYSKTCAARIGKSGRKIDLTIKLLPRSLHCKGRFDEVCHKRKEVWIEYNNATEKCEEVVCTRNGAEVLQQQSVCTNNHRCVLDGEMPDEAPMCKCVKGHMICTGPIISS